MQSELCNVTSLLHFTIGEDLEATCYVKFLKNTKKTKMWK